MDSRSLAEQEKDIRDLLRRAERTPVKTSALRRDTLKRLIDLAHSPHPSLKVIAATNIKLFIKDFPDLEDDAINAVYDLCEDPVSNVRIKGYAAIVDVSREQTKWVKRNVDVLVQLLQSDEPEEVTVVKRALTQHLDMDPVVTLGVLCDQIVPTDEPLDEEEQSIRDRLRTLVLAFLSGEAKRPLVERHASAPGPAEQLLVSGLLKALTRLSPSDVDMIVKDVIVALPSFKSSPSRGEELLSIILTQLRATLKSDLPPSMERASLNNSRYYLDLASFVAVDKALAPPTSLLRFYYTSLTPKLVLGRLCEEDQVYVINQVARVFAACEAISSSPPVAPAADLGKPAGSPPEPANDVALRKQFPEACAVLFQVFADIKADRQRPWVACRTLVEGIARRKRDNHWQIPQHIASALRRLESIPISQEAPADAKAAREQVHSVIRSLLEPVKPPAISSKQPTSTSPNKTTTDGQKGNVEKITNRSANGDAHAKNGTADTNATSSKPDERRIMNVNKRKLDAVEPAPIAMTSGRPKGSAPPGNPATVHGSASLPPRPSAATVASSGISVPSGPRVDRQRQGPPSRGRSARSPPSAPDANATGTAGPSTSHTAIASGSASAVMGSPHGSKRLRTTPEGSAAGPPAGSESDVRRGGADDIGRGKKGSTSPVTAEEPKSIPSLLSRLAGGAQNNRSSGPSTPEHEQDQRDRARGRGRGRRGSRAQEAERNGEASKGAPSSSVPAKRRADETMSVSRPASSAASQQRGRPSNASVELDVDPVGGLRIRGAAKAITQAPGDSSKRGPSTLLERLQQSEGGRLSPDGGGRKKRRTKV